jgi:preprotein translocase subunit SecA
MLDFITKTIAKIVGNKNDKDRKELFPYVEKVNAEYAKLRSISDDELRGMTRSLMEKIDQSLQA